MAALTNFYRAVTYRGREGYVAWLLHRIAGIGVFVFLALHIFDIFLMSFGPGVFESLLFIYHKFAFKLLIVFGLFPGVLYHALNGMRVVTMDFWPSTGKYEARLFWAQIAIFVAAYIPSATLMFMAMFR
jgi:succinate dehydrogenase / fumarate reductase cytochrome b subunit